MTDEPINLVLSRLNRLDDKIDRLIDRVSELTTRVGSLETLTAHIHVDMAAQSVRIDHLSSGIEQVERRLQLRDA